MTTMIDTGKNFGGNAVRSIAAAESGRHFFANDRYTYYLWVTKDSEEISILDLGSFSVFVLSMVAGSRVTVAGSGQELHAGDAVQVESAPFALAVAGGGVRLLVAGTRAASGRESGVTVIPSAKIYKVTKPWGHELWISGEHPNYAFKEISIKQGTKTSLQYHLHKQETNVLFEGTTRLYYKKDQDVPNDSVNAVNLGSVDMSAVASIDVSPPVIHRLEALSDVLLYEVSTPHLDDVIRIQDDAGRKDGRISTEHKK